jgi:hypothetical protein
MSTYRWLEFHDSRVLALHRTPDVARIDLDAYVHQWEGHGSSRRGTGWMQNVRLEVAEPVVAQQLTSFPATLSSGRATSDDAGGLSLPTVVNEPVVVDLQATSGERLVVSGKRLEALALAEPRFVEDLPTDMDPQRTAN